MTGESRKQTFHKQLVPIWSAATLTQTIGLPFPHVVKLDVDGFEQQVLTGMEWLLHSADLRAILCELDVRRDADLIAWLDTRGWVIAEQYERRGTVYYAKFERTPNPELIATFSGNGVAILPDLAVTTANEALVTVVDNTMPAPPPKPPESQDPNVRIGHPRPKRGKR